MLTVQTDPTNTYSVTRCDFADMAELPTGRYTGAANRTTFASRDREIANLAEADAWRREWYGGITGMPQAVSLLTDGWQEGATAASALAPRLTHIVPPPKSIKRRVRWMDDGTELHIDRAMAGDWDVAWRNTGPHLTSTPKLISIGAFFGGLGSVSHAEMFWNAAQMIVITDLLENAGYSVELRAIKHNSIGGWPRRNFLIDVTVKRFGQPLRADIIASTFGHAGVYRTFGFMLSMTSPYNIGSGLGSSIAIRPGIDRAVADGLIQPVDYVLEEAGDIDTAARQVTEALTILTEPTR